MHDQVVLSRRRWIFNKIHLQYLAGRFLLNLYAWLVPMATARASTPCP